MRLHKGGVVGLAVFSSFFFFQQRQGKQTCGGIG
jgi:hypothetical protein